MRYTECVLDGCLCREESGELGMAAPQGPGALQDALKEGRSLLLPLCVR